MNEHEDKIIFEESGSIQLFDPDSRLTSEERQAKYQREQDEAITRAVIRAIQDNPELRRELMQALGIQETSE
jgi:hypothetical protein